MTNTNGSGNNPRYKKENNPKALGSHYFEHNFGLWAKEIEVTFNLKAELYGENKELCGKNKYKITITHTDLMNALDEVLNENKFTSQDAIEDYNPLEHTNNVNEKIQYIEQVISTIESGQQIQQKDLNDCFQLHEKEFRLPILQNFEGINAWRKTALYFAKNSSKKEKKIYPELWWVNIAGRLICIKNPTDLSYSLYCSDHGSIDLIQLHQANVIMNNYYTKNGLIAKNNNPPTILNVALCIKTIEKYQNKKEDKKIKTTEADKSLLETLQLTFFKNLWNTYKILPDGTLKNTLNNILKQYILKQYILKQYILKQYTDISNKTCKYYDAQLLQHILSELKFQKRFVTNIVNKDIGLNTYNYIASLENHNLALKLTTQENNTINETIQNLENIIKLKKQVYLGRLCNYMMLKESLNNIYRPVDSYADSEKGPSYPEFLNTINAFTEEEKKSITGHIRSLLENSNYKINDNQKLASIVPCLTATFFLSEDARYNKAFFSSLMILDMLEITKASKIRYSWNNVLDYPTLIKDITNTEDKDIAMAIGGRHPMANKGSSKIGEYWINIEKSLKHNTMNTTGEVYSKMKEYSLLVDWTFLALKKALQIKSSRNIPATTFSSTKKNLAMDEIYLKDDKITCCWHNFYLYDIVTKLLDKNLHTLVIDMEKCHPNKAMTCSDVTSENHEKTKQITNIYMKKSKLHMENRTLYMNKIKEIGINIDTKNKKFKEKFKKFPKEIPDLEDVKAYYTSANSTTDNPTKLPKKAFINMIKNIFQRRATSSLYLLNTNPKTPTNTPAAAFAEPENQEQQELQPIGSDFLQSIKIEGAEVDSIDLKLILARAQHTPRNTP